MNNQIKEKPGIKKLRVKDTYFLRLLIIMIATLVILSIIETEKFLTFDSFQSMAYQFPQYGILSIGVMLAMISGGIDLSVVGVANLSAVLAAKTMLELAPEDESGTVIGVILAAVVVGLVCGVVSGLFNGLLISRIGIPPIMATLASMQVFRGITIVLTKGNPISGLPAQYSNFVNTAVFNVLPVPVIVFAILAILIYLLLNKTVYGKKLYMVGTNDTAAIFSGINVKSILTSTYIISGVMASLAGLVMMGRMNSAKADYGTQYALQCVLVVVLGGVNPNGGYGKIGSVTLAILILQFLSTGLNMFPEISNFYRSLIWGAVLLLVLVINHLQAKNSQRAVIKEK
jgi:simple sugar transport system permease protein